MNGAPNVVQFGGGERRTCFSALLCRVVPVAIFPAHPYTHFHSKTSLIESSEPHRERQIPDPAVPVRHRWHLRGLLPHSIPLGWPVDIEPGQKPLRRTNILRRTFSFRGIPRRERSIQLLIPLRWQRLLRSFRYTTSCTQISPHAIALKGLADAVSTNARWELSADGKILTVKADRVQIDGSVKKQEKVFERISGSSGFNGQWRETKPLESLSETVVLILNYSAFHFENAETGQFSDSRANDAPSPIRGANQPDGFTRSVRDSWPATASNRRYFPGSGHRRTTWKVSDDGHTLYEESWVPQSPAQKDLLVYQRP